MIKYKLEIFKLQKIKKKKQIKILTKNFVTFVIVSLETINIILVKSVSKKFIISVQMKRKLYVYSVQMNDTEY